MIGNCSTCQHWKCYRTTDNLGTCNRYPPVLDPVMALENRAKMETTDTDLCWITPSTLGADECGEYIPKANRRGKR